jgi:hypothetical protein
MTDDSARAVHRYLSLAGSNGTFAAEVLRLFLEERRMVAQEKINEGRHQVVYKIDDVITVRVQVQIDSSRNRVGKLLYKSKGPFIVKEVLGTGSYMVQRWNKDNALLLKFHGSDMYLLSPGLLPCDPLDTPDLRYLNGLRGIVTNPLELNLGVKLFNEQWFDGN